MLGASLRDPQFEEIGVVSATVLTGCMSSVQALGS